MKSAATALLLALLAVETSAQTINAPNGELLRLPDGTFVGTSHSGGTDNYGTIFRLSAQTEITVLASFTNDVGLAKGANPRAGLVRDPAGILWGTTEQGGANSLGTVFKFSPGNRKLTTMVEFDGATRGSRPATALVRDAAGDFLGTTRQGGTADFGTIFKVNKTTGALTTLIQFSGVAGNFKGSDPRGALFIDGAGAIWGTTSAGGAGDLGTVFKLDGSTFTTVAEFTGTLPGALGTAPEAALILSGGKLWGTTVRGGSANDAGTVFTINPATLAFTSVVSFAGANGANPRAPLTAGTPPALLGTTENGGADDLGTVFSLDSTTGAITTLASFSGTAGNARGAHPRAGLTADTGTLFFGSATQGGREDTGLVYSLDPTSGAGGFGGVIDSNPAPGPKPATVKPPDKTQTTGPAGSQIALGGNLPDDPNISEVLVSINDGPFIAATILPGPPATWSLGVFPENGTNVIVIKTLNQDGGISPPTTFSFEFTTVRPEIIGTYAGLVLPVGAGPPLKFSGLLTLNVLATGRFTGKLVIGGLPAAITLKGTFANSGIARFGKKGTPTLTIPRTKQSPLSLELALDPTLPFTGALAGTISENSATAATLGAAQGLYTAKKNPAAPFLPVPATLLNPLADKGSYTGVFRALAPTPSFPPDKFPQGDGIATLKIAPNGSVKLVAKLADGVSISTGGPLVGADTLPFFILAYGKRGAVTGELQFRDVPGQTDADGTAVLWIRPADPKAKNYREGWVDGLTVDFEGSKFFVPKGGALTPLGNAPSAAAKNAELTLTAGGILSTAGNELAVGVGGKTRVLGAITGGTALQKLAVTLSASGGVGGAFIHPVTTLPTTLVGVVLQKQKTAAGYFLAAPAKGSPPAVTQSSGRVEIIGQ